MPVYNVIRKSDGVKVYAYSSDVVIEWQGMELATHDHVVDTEPQAPEEVINLKEWYIVVGAFYDRFGAYKIPILASQDPIVQAIIKDTTVRKYIDLKGRKEELTQALMLIQSKGYPVDIATILDVKPSEQERYDS